MADKENQPEDNQELNLNEEEKDEERSAEQDYNTIFDDSYTEVESEKETDGAEEDNREAETVASQPDSDTSLEEKKKSESKPKDSSSNSKSSDKNKKTNKEKKDPDIIQEEKEDVAPIAQDTKEQKTSRSLAKKILAAAAALITLLVGIYFGNLYFQIHQVRQEVASTTTTTTTMPEKTVYINASGGLNMRKDPISSSDVLAVIPNGTKLTVINEQDGWYKVQYNGQTGWISKDYTSSESPLVYKNTDYGFQLTFPKDWSSYKVVKKDVNNGDGTISPTLYVGIKVSDPNYNSEVGKGYADMFVISVYTPGEWNNIKNGGGPIPSVLAKNDNYVFTSLPSQASPDDVASERNEISDTLKTFKFF